MDLSLRDIEAMHSRYIDQVKAFLGVKWEGDRSVRPLAAHQLALHLERYGCQSIGEFGSGFTTPVLRQALPGLAIRTFEDNADWRGFINRMLARRGDMAEVEDIEEFRASTRLLSAPPFDAIFVDHGPTMAARWDDLPWLSSLLRRGGYLFLDDWWPEGRRPYRSTKRAIRILSRMGYDLYPLEQSRPSPSDKALCLATRKPGALV